MNSLSAVLHIAAAISMVAAAPLVSAQSGMGKYQQLYAQGSVQTVSGTVQSVGLAVPPGVRAQAVTLMLKTPTETLSVQLGPEAFVQQLPAQIVAGDKIKVTGSRVTVEGKTLLLAARIEKNGQTLVFRNDAGVPAWAGR